METRSNDIVWFPGMSGGIGALLTSLVTLVHVRSQNAALAGAKLMLALHVNEADRTSAEALIRLLGLSELVDTRALFTFNEVTPMPDVPPAGPEAFTALRNMITSSNTVHGSVHERRLCVHVRPVKRQDRSNRYCWCLQDYYRDALSYIGTAARIDEAVIVSADLGVARRKCVDPAVASLGKGTHISFGKTPQDDFLTLMQSRYAVVGNSRFALWARLIASWLDAKSNTVVPEHAVYDGKAWGSAEDLLGVGPVASWTAQHVMRLLY